MNFWQLEFSSNNFSGFIDTEVFLYLEYLFDLSHNSLSVISKPMATLPPELFSLSLSSCNIKEFPHFLKNAKNIQFLYLSNNHMDGEISPWFGSMGQDSLFYLNLSHNNLTGGLKCPWNEIRYLDLESNMFSGSLPNSICNLSGVYIKQPPVTSKCLT